MTDRLVLLKRSVGAIARRRHPAQLLEGEEAIAFLTQDGIRYGRFSFKSGLVFGFTQVGASAIAALAADLRQADLAYKRGSSLPTFASAVAGTVLDKFGEVATPTVTVADLIALEADLRTWFARIAVPTTRYIPCALVAERVAPFDIGPITFVHASELAMHPRSPISSGMAQIELDPLYRALQERPRHGSPSSRWVGASRRAPPNERTWQLMSPSPRSSSSFHLPMVSRLRA